MEMVEEDVVEVSAVEIICDEMTAEPRMGFIRSAVVPVRTTSSTGNFFGLDDGSSNSFLSFLWRQDGHRAIFGSFYIKIYCKGLLGISSLSAHYLRSGRGAGGLLERRRRHVLEVRWLDRGQIGGKDSGLSFGGRCCREGTRRDGDGNGG